jgi:hypothetical protein
MKRPGAQVFPDCQGYPKVRAGPGIDPDYFLAALPTRPTTSCVRLEGASHSAAGNEDIIALDAGTRLEIAAVVENQVGSRSAVETAARIGSGRDSSGGAAVENNFSLVEREGAEVVE